MYENYLPCFNYAAESFTNILGKFAALKDDKIDSNFHDLPIIINPGQSETIANIKFQKNTNYDFRIILNGALRPKQTVNIGYKGQ